VKSYWIDRLLNARSTKSVWKTEFAVVPGDTRDHLVQKVSSENFLKKLKGKLLFSACGNGYWGLNCSSACNLSRCEQCDMAYGCTTCRRSFFGKECSSEN
jgi:hypothetical protein